MADPLESGVIGPIDWRHLVACPSPDVVGPDGASFQPLPSDFSESAGATESLPRPTLGFIGAGRVATSLAQTLAAAGYTIPAIASRSRDSAERLTSRIAGASTMDVQTVADTAELVFITTPDDAIAEIAAALTWRPGSIVVHTSGALSLDVLRPIQAAGASAGSIHPLQTFAGDLADPPALSGATFALEGNERSLSVLHPIVQALGGQAITLPPGAKTLYHAAAVFVSNYTVTLTKLATELWASFGVPPEMALPALLPLLQGTVRNLEALGLPQALTGPIARGDFGTVERHLDRLTLRAPALLDLYKALGRETLVIAEARGGIPEQSIEELAKLLVPSEGVVHGGLC